jgi:hypothetical protein
VTGSDDLQEGAWVIADSEDVILPNELGPNPGCILPHASVARGALAEPVLVTRHERRPGRE